MKTTGIAGLGATALVLLSAFVGCGESDASSQNATQDGADAQPDAVQTDGTSGDAGEDANAVDGDVESGDAGPDALGEGGSLDAADAPDVAPTPGSVIDDDPAGRTWPTAHGEAMVSLWQDDALGALTITIDDNTAPDHAWWVSQSQTYGLRLTWFVITGRVETGAYWGTWADWAALIAQGHDVQSHTVTHLSGDLTIDEEYGDSQVAIEANLPDTRALTLAYPGGTNSSLNDVGVAAQYYIGARSTVGHDNPVTDIDYMSVNSISGQFVLTPDHWAGLPNVVVYNDAHPKSYRAWHCIHYHQVGDEQNAIEGFEFIKAHEGDLWVGLFREVALYGQEREAATLAVPNATDDLVELDLTDTLDDSTFDYPLTIKVGLANTWDEATATQGGEPTQVELITHAGERFALVRAVPDRGVVRLTRVP
jgi:Polysaccharide deacetylase